MPAQFKNNATATLAASISSSATTIVLSSSLGALFPSLTVGQFFFATLFNAVGTYEIVKVTARAGDSLTVIRAQDGTTASAFIAGDGFAQRIVAANFANIPQLDASNTFTGANNFTGGSITGAAISTGSINNTPIGSTTRNTGYFSSASVTDLAVNNVVLGNGTNPLQGVAPGTTGNVLTSTGTNWVSSPLAGGLAAGGCVYENSQIIIANYTLAAGKNGLSAGPITIDTGVVVTVDTGSTWVVV